MVCGWFDAYDKTSVEEEYANLNLIDATYGVPEIDEFKNLTYAMLYSGEDIETTESKILANMEKMAGESDSSYLRYWNSVDDSEAIAFACDVPTEEKNRYRYLIYNDGEYTAISYAGGMLEMGNSKLWADLAGSNLFDKDYEATYRPVFVEDAEIIAQYSLPEDNIQGVSYTVLDGELSLEDAVSVAEDQLEEYYFAKSDYLEFHVYEVYVYQLTTGECFYYFKLQGYLDDIPVNYESGSVLESETGLYPVGIEDIVAVIYTDRISYFWSNCGYENGEVKTVKASDMITLEAACEIVSENLSSEKVFNIADVSLVYYVANHTSYDNPPRGDSWTDYREVRLTYQFTVDNPQILKYSKLTFIVDAETGYMYTYSE